MEKFFLDARDLDFFCPLNTAITLPVEERANLSAFSTFVQFGLIWFCPFPLPLGVWVVIMALPGLISYILADATIEIHTPLI